MHAQRNEQYHLHEAKSLKNLGNEPRLEAMYAVVDRTSDSQGPTPHYTVPKHV
jgi:hypothetical protein